ncbi:MAG: exodeoxyribonuclease V subunit alpha [Neisseriaceae bacterium]|nr:exodeoxyribonuclease V subunit alpha [Neisseriaceae bacterium]
MALKAVAGIAPERQEHPIYLATASVLGAIAPSAFALVAPYLRQLVHHLDEGHTCLPLAPWQVKELTQAMPLVSTQPDVVAPLLLWRQQLSFMRQWQEEAELAQRLLALSQQPAPAFRAAEAQLVLDALFGHDNHDRQKQAAALSLLQAFLLISGGPGTGKTTTVAKIVATLLLVLKQPITIALAAPTGKAAAHMATAFQKAFAALQGQLDWVMQDELFAFVPVIEGLQGQTLHRLLKLNPLTQQARYHQDQPLPYDLIIVDEASMIDGGMMRQLLAAIAPNSRLILLGDKDQLPSVGAGAVVQALFRPTALSEAVATRLNTYLPKHDLPSVAEAGLAQCVLALTHSHRFAADSGIGALARAVNQAPADIEPAFAHFSEQLRLLPEVSALYAHLYQAQAQYWAAVQAQDVAKVFQHQQDIIVLSALKDDAVRFNDVYEGYLAKRGHRQSADVFYPGKVIMISGNDYPLNLFNGDIGIVLADEEQGLKAYFEGADGFRALPLSMLPEHETAFAFTVHKSQGSEYQQVWLLPAKLSADGDGQAHALMSRALVYTAITRARQAFGLVGDLTLLIAAARQVAVRNSLLPLLL